MEIADAERVYAEAAAGSVAGPRPQRRGQIDDQNAKAAAAAPEQKQRGVEAAEQQGKNGRGCDDHRASIGIGLLLGAAPAGSRPPSGRHMD